MSFSQVATAHGGLGLGRERNSGYLGALHPASLVRSLQEHRRHQRECRHLLELPDYLLDDIGLTRREITEAMRRRLF
jgi:uncharacterized protein YjiS (DUF1127 family)